MKAFGERLDESREQLEDCSRCFQLLEAARESLEEDGKEVEEFKRLAQKSENGRLVEIYKVIFILISSHSSKVGKRVY